MRLEALLTQQQLADLFGVSWKTIERWRHEGTGPAWVRVGQGVRYQPYDVKAWLDRRRHGEHGQKHLAEGDTA